MFLGLHFGSSMVCSFIFLHMLFIWPNVSIISIFSWLVIRLVLQSNKFREGTLLVVAHEGWNKTRTKQLSAIFFQCTSFNVRKIHIFLEKNSGNKLSGKLNDQWWKIYRITSYKYKNLYQIKVKMLLTKDRNH